VRPQLNTTAIVLAAGKGKRLGALASKPLVEINSKPVLSYCLYTLSRHPEITGIVVVANSQNLQGVKNIIKESGVGKVRAVILGGKRRQDSVLAGLKALDNKAGLVLIHDADRPFIDRKDLTRVLSAAGTCGAAILGIPVKATIKQGKRQKAKGKTCLPLIIEKTIERDRLWEAQTPQVFRREIILEAYRRFKDISVTDDSSLVERLGYPVIIVQGSELNIKITTPGDLILAETIARE